MLLELNDIFLQAQTGIDNGNLKFCKGNGSVINTSVELYCRGISAKTLRSNYFAETCQKHCSLDPRSSFNTRRHGFDNSYEVGDHSKVESEAESGRRTLLGNFQRHFDYSLQNASPCAVFDADKVDRPVSTCIYYLLPSGRFSHLHRIPCAEVWHFYFGEPITVVELHDDDGSIEFTCLGPDLLADDQVMQHIVPPNVWFGAFPTKDFVVSSELTPVKTASRNPEEHFSLVGCTCAPAFQFDDFEMAARTELISRFPKYAPLISMLTFPD
ncbi:uncharacterized protein LOC127263931 isoform X2 [Andrographis paniculata]|uniref:uncharacterized protein LOC127263931 isoform X2 n=1 Tax=Andrographis paniculata TaxID=175694 RepID=UPI0021E91095|nr:uncharacterized protein LOC127263931 isoform X2 [Andrographis paniculata]